MYHNLLQTDGLSKIVQDLWDRRCRGNSKAAAAFTVPSVGGVVGVAGVQLPANLQPALRQASAEIATAAA